MSTPLWARVLEHHFARIGAGELVVRGPGYANRFSGADPGPAGALEVVRPRRLLLRLARSGALGFGEGFLAGDWQSPDLFPLLECLARNQAAMVPTQRLSPGRVLALLKHRARWNTRRGARRNIEAHYDLGNDFYGLWLDESMTYSCAFFDRGAATLAAAQQEKYRRALARLDASGGARVLEIGCGWGGCAAAGLARGLDWTGVTLSPAQLRVARERSPRARLALTDFRDLTGRYDHLVSIEMLEAVGERLWPAFFAKASSLLHQAGRMALQVIVIQPEYFPRYRRGADFIQRHVFPGGMLPTAERLRAAAREAGLEMTDASFHAGDYARTLAHWDANVRARREEIVALGLDARFLRLWRYYLAYCAAGFRSGRIDLLQATVARP